MMQIGWLVACLLHVLVCAVLWLQPVPGQRYGCVFWVQLLVPVWGPLTGILLRTKAACPARHDGRTLVQREEAALRTELLGPAADAAEVVPLEEALLINSARQRRRLILSVLEEDPVPYYALLQQARRNDDSEVVHYAATAMAQISKQYDLKLQALAQRCAAAPQDEKAAEAYRQALQQVLAMGIVQGRTAEQRRRELAGLLQQKFQTKSEYACGCLLAQTWLDLQEDAAAEAVLAVLEQRWPQKEALWLLRLRLAVCRRDGAAIERVLQEIRARHIYLHAENRATVRFWQKSGEKEGVGRESVVG